MESTTPSENITMAQEVDGQRHDRTALFVYGTETGNSQDVAEELGRTAERLHFATRVSEMDTIDLVGQASTASCKGLCML